MKLSRKNTWVVGLTGNMASGKSVALSYFAKQGALTLSADELVRQLYASDEVQKKLISWFGSCESSKIAQEVFNNSSSREKLEKFLHPKVLKLAREEIKKTTRSLIVFEVPLLFEAGWNKFTDLNVLVVGNPHTLKQRLQARRVTVAEYKRRIIAQMPDSEKARLADVILFNGGSKKDLGLKIERLCKAFRYIYGLK